MSARFALVRSWNDPIVADVLIHNRAHYEDRQLRGAAEIYERAHAWGHLPMQMEFQTFLAALDRGDDPFTRRCCGGEAIES